MDFVLVLLLQLLLFDPAKLVDPLEMLAASQCQPWMSADWMLAGGRH